MLGLYISQMSILHDKIYTHFQYLQHFVQQVSQQIWLVYLIQDIIIMVQDVIIMVQDVIVMVQDVFIMIQDILIILVLIHSFLVLVT